MAVATLMAPSGTALLAAPREPAAGITPPVSSNAPASAAAVAPGPQLRLRRYVNGVEVMVEGIGVSPQLQQRRSGTTWEGLITVTTPLEAAPSQSLALPEAGIDSVSLDGSGTRFRVQVRPMPGYPLGRPVISADGRSLILSFATSPQASMQTSRFDITTPGRIPQPAYAPPLQPRASAPPVGDMAVGTMMLKNRSVIEVGGPQITLTLNNAPARDVLMTLARMGGYGFVYVDEESQDDSKGELNAKSAKPVSISFVNEKYSKAINFVLLSSGMQARLEGRTIIVGPNVLAKSLGAQLSKIYRLNQASSTSAANYLASLGASITLVNTITNTVSSGTSQANQVAGGEATQQTKSQNITTTETFGAAVGPLKGLIGTTDSRLQTITLIGEPSLVAVAENYLRQIDLRQRQVALAVKILDVTLGNDATTSNSFAFRYGNNFIVNDEGRLLAAFNNRLPPTSQQFNNYANGFDDPEAPESNYPPLNPGIPYQENNFYNYIRATIQSSSTKLLAAPTLVLSENSEFNQSGKKSASTSSSAGGGSGNQSDYFTDQSIGRANANESFATVGTQVVASFEVTPGQNGAPPSCQPKFQTSGLTLGARVAKIDDNGFVTFSLTPTVSAVTGTDTVDNCGNISILSLRRLETGGVRVRDGQTLILTGVISDQDSQAVTKWPILGDIPLIGQFFRSTSGSRRKSELVILVTPRIISDDQNGSFGYGYTPSTNDAKQILAPGSDF